LAAFVPIGKHEAALKQEFLKCNNAHNLTNVKRVKSEMGIFSDYPHYYTMQKEGGTTTQTILYAMRNSENGDFIFSRQEGVFCLYGPNFVGVLRPNMLGTYF
jgi:hypothetical protein